MGKRWQTKSIGTKFFYVNVKLCFEYLCQVSSKSKAAFAGHEQIENLGFIGLFATKMLVQSLNQDNLFPLLLLVISIYFY